MAAHVVGFKWIYETVLLEWLASGFLNVREERWGFHCDAYGKLLGFSKASIDCKYLEPYFYQRACTTMDQVIWAEPLYTCCYLFLTVILGLPF